MSRWWVEGFDTGGQPAAAAGIGTSDPLIKAVAETQRHV